ncbi:hypothetical protein ZHAS_00003224 [Anopheles sinensis]|uniref:RRP15-like protein n=1 Tax=Anopheles sinensis TaxID=74873 RepID=A0A084VDW8_ANOSI|nr:hypothetical protein ZHAS_00003224 [Anopheles sinensis]
MLKVAKKAKATPLPAPESDSDSADSSADEEFLSDAEYPMSEDENAGDNIEASDDETKDRDESRGPTKWAKAMAKFLRKTTDAKILSKATTEAEIERKKKESSTYKFEVVGQEGTVKKEGQEDKPDDIELMRELLRQKALLKKERRKDILGLRVRPTIGDYERERTLRKVATKGTVQLFNAVRKQQKEVNRKLEEAGKLEYKREKVLKSLSKKEFLDALMNGPRAKSELVDNLVKKEEDEDVDEDVKSEVDSDEEPKSTWGPLRADFLTGKKSGWDKEYAEDERNVPDDLDDDADSD